ncbi:MAG: DNA repair protein RecO [Chloroflexi bacterium]|nr:DNA repair protein RecO [Chloroflexota bacterium]
MMAGRERLYRTEGIVLRRTDTGEADRLVTVLSPDHGKLRLLAKGARKPSSRKSGHLELFSHTRLLVARGRTWDIITQAETIEPFLALRQDLLRTSYAYYLAELVDKFTAEEGLPSLPLFRLLLETLRRLCNAPVLPSEARYFELQLLDLAGYRPELRYCLNCHRPVKQAFFSPSQGGIFGAECVGGHQGVKKLSEGALSKLRLLQTAAPQQLAGLVLTPDEEKELEDVLGRYISYLLEARPKSLGFLKKIRRQETVTVENLQK